jgi:hypothetical protein
MLNPHKQRQPDEPKPTRRSVLMPVLVALAGVTTVAAYLYWQDMTRLPRPIGHIGTLTYPGSEGRGYESYGSEHLSDTLTTDPKRLLSIYPGDRPLMPAEAVLPPHPQSADFMGVRRSAEGLIEELTVYNVAGAEAEAVRAHCREAALAAGFTPLPTATASDAGRATELFTRVAAPAPGDPRVLQTLVVRITPRGDEVRAVVWLRYPMSRTR